MNLKINWDALGITASLACAIHCALLPLFFTSLPILGINIIENPVVDRKIAPELVHPRDPRHIVLRQHVGKEQDHDQQQDQPENDDDATHGWPRD